MKKKIYCQPTDCEHCPYPDCIGIVRQKPGRKKMDPDIVHQHRLSYNRRYNAAHREEINQKNRERYYAKKNS